MTILAIGRAFDGLDVDVREASWSGSTLRLAGDLHLGAVTAANRAGTAAAVRDRLLALVNSRDEQAVPVTWTQDSTIDGWFRPTAATVDYSAASLTDGYCSWSCELEAVDGTPQLEVVGFFGVVNNDQSVTNAGVAAVSGGTIVGVPGAAVDIYASGGTFSARSSATTRASETGNVSVMAGTATSLPSSLVSLYTVAASDHYDGACELRGTYGGVTDQLCLGRNMQPLGGSGLKVSNGLIRCGFNASGAVVIEAWDSGAWRTVGPGTWPITSVLPPSGSTTATFACTTSSGVQVLRNSPEAVSVRIFNCTDLATLGRTWMDITVKRGSRMVNFHLQGQGCGRTTVKPSTSTAGAAITGGLQQNANDANGNRYIVVGSRGRNYSGASYSWSGNTTTGALTQQTAISTEWWGDAPFGIGCCVDGSSSTGINTAQNVAYEFFAGRTETARVVLR